MKPREELMLLLELNNFDIIKFKLKMQLEYEDTGNLNLYIHKKYKDLLICHYLFEKDLDLYRRNPLSYRENWGSEVKSIDQFFVNHPDLEEEIILSDFLHLESFNEVHKESILFDILDRWVEEYREASITRMENLREMIKLLPKKGKKYKKPSKIAFVITILIAMTNILLYKNPTIIQPSFSSFISDFVRDWNQLLYDLPWYSLFGVVAISLLITYSIFNNLLSKIIKDVKSVKNKHSEKTFDKWEIDMKNAQLKQSGILEDYVDLVVKKPDESFFDLKILNRPEILMDKFRSYVRMVEKKYDWMTKNYSKLMTSIRISFIFVILFNLTFFVLGIAIIGGWVNV